MGVVIRAAVLLAGASLASCLSDPELKSCADFPAGTPGCPAPCELYCELAVAHCGEFAGEQDALSACRSICLERTFAAGAPNDTEGNTLECRIEHAQRAAGDTTACLAAALDGSTACVDDTCARYCTEMQQRCPNAFPSETYCRSLCPTFPTAPNDADANTVQCRLKYALAGQCEAASTNGGGVCGEPCDMYCALAQRNCTGDQQLYADEAECREVCGLLRQDGPHDDWQFTIEGDTVQCRTYHVGPPAVEHAPTHCPHAAVYNTVHCGTDECAVFCDLADRHCPGRFGDGPACLAACRARQLRDEALAVPGQGGRCDE